jgi:hypothetical protein
MPSQQTVPFLSLGGFQLHDYHVVVLVGFLGGKKVGWGEGRSILFFSFCSQFSGNKLIPFSFLLLTGHGMKRIRILHPYQVAQRS